VVPGVLASYLGILIPAELVRGLEEQWELQRIILQLFLLAAVMLICNIVQGRMNVYNGFNVKAIQKWVGHANAETTMNVYAKVKESHKQHIGEALGEKFQNAI
jgi:integrase